MSVRKVKKQLHKKGIYRWFGFPWFRDMSRMVDTDSKRRHVRIAKEKEKYYRGK